jgi:catechol 2,3-dioxygenase-like lactoylglutathione lyase family enzyme
MNLNAPPFDRSSEDVGNIVEFGHVNLRVPDQATALAFYVEGLGLTRDPAYRTGRDNAWINVGTAQFHLPVGAPQVLRGTIHLVMPDLDPLRERLAAVRGRLDGTAFDVAERDDAVEVTCPWGNRIQVHAPDPERFGHLQLGMPRIDFETGPGTAARIARFYEVVFGGIARCGQQPGGLEACVAAGPGSWLVYRETARSPAAYDGHHIQVTVADFSGVHRRLQQHGLITEESDQHQYRFREIVDVDRGDALVLLEHEVRSMRHPLFGRSLANDGLASVDRSAIRPRVLPPATVNA